MIITQGYGPDQLIVSQGYGDSDTPTTPYPLYISINRSHEYEISISKGGCP